MATIRPNAEPAATSVQAGDIFLIDGATGVRALAANVLLGYTTTPTAAGTTTLTNASTKQQFFTGATTQTVLLPVTSTLALGWGFLFDNDSAGAVTIQSSGANNVLILAQGTRAFVECIAITGTTAASWDVAYLGSVVASGKVLTVSNSLTLVGTDATTITFPAAGIGYVTGIGAGGTVTQLTSRTTGVTLNTLTGAITLFAAAGVVSTWFSFTVTNSSVAATDAIQVSVKSGTNTYVAVASAVAAGSFQMSVECILGTATDSPVINFAVIKGAAS